jgi:hypothetical protein
MIDASMKQALPPKLDELVRNNQMAGEEILLCIKGLQQEFLVCTDRRVMIVKSGFMTGNTFGSNLFQLSYANVTSAQVKSGFLGGYFELSTGGMQNTPKHLMNSAAKGQPTAQHSPNCVSFHSSYAERFRTACAFILERTELVAAWVTPSQMSQTP